MKAQKRANAEDLLRSLKRVRKPKNSIENSENKTPNAVPFSSRNLPNAEEIGASSTQTPKFQSMFNRNPSYGMLRPDRSDSECESEE